MRGTLEERFWAKVERTDDCWEWKASLTTTGYGQFAIDRLPHRAHRVSWLLANGPIPTGLFVCHHCDNPKCVRPDHLFLGTNSDNMRDAIRKGRMSPPALRPGWKYVKPSFRTLKQVCKRGHDLIGDNVLPRNRRCRICNNARSRLHMQKVRLRRTHAA